MSDNINGFPVPEKPETREEQYLSAIAQVTPATQIPPKPLTRVEAYLNKIVENGTGGGGGGTTNYNALENKPQINSHELSGNKSSSDLGLQAALTETQLAAVNSGIDSTKVEQIETNKNNISLIYDNLDTFTKKAFSAYETATSPTASGSFYGFATPYEFHGDVVKIDVNGAYSMTDVSSAVYTLTIYDTNFTTIIAQTTKSISAKNGYETFTFENPVHLNGTYYFCVETTGTARFHIVNATNSNSKRSASLPNHFKMVSTGTWANNTTGYDMDIIIYAKYYSFSAIKNVVYVGSTSECQYSNVQDAINNISDDTADNPYIIYVKSGIYPTFSMYYSDAARTTVVGRPRYISIIGLGCKDDVIFFDNRGNYKFSPCEIVTNGLIKNISFIDKTDAQHHTQQPNKTMAYAVHLDFGGCHVTFEDCYFYSNAGAALGMGTRKNGIYEFENCRFESDNDGTYGEVGQGAFFSHTASANDETNQKLRVHNCIAIATGQAVGARLAVTSGFTGGTWSYELQNFGAFGNNGASVSLTDPDSNLLSPYNFNNIPNTLNG